MKKMLLIALIFLPSSLFAQLEVRGGLLDNCADVDALQSSGSFTETRDRARLFLEGIEQELSGVIAQLFLEQIGEWTRVSIEQNQVMGFNNITAGL